MAGIGTFTKAWAHGTRACYVQRRCRCEPCRAANRQYYHALQARAVSAAATVVVDAGPCAQVWTRPDGSTATRRYARACPGVNGQACRFRRHLRKDSKGGVCGSCRLQLHGVWNGLVDTAPARAHLKQLSRRGMGHRSVADLASVPKSIVLQIMTGTKRRARSRTVLAILAVEYQHAADKQLVAAGTTMKRLDALKEEGYTQTEIARRLGSRARVPALQLKTKKITARSAMKVEQLWRRETMPDLEVRA